MLLAYAESADLNQTSLALILGGLLIVAAVAILAFALILIAGVRRHRYADLIIVAAIVWGALAAGSGLYAQVSQTNWQKEYTLRLESGYLNPQDTNDAPQLPWKTWTALGLAYGVMVVWAFSQKRATEGES
jgi:hypothetical protein